MDADQSARRLAVEKLNVHDPDYYLFEGQSSLPTFTGDTLTD